MAEHGGVQEEERAQLWRLSQMTLDALRRRDLAPGPAAYHIWFLYEAGADAELVETLQRLDHHQTPIDDALLDSLFHRFVLSRYGVGVLDQEIGDFGDVIDRADARTADTVRDLGAYARTLVEADGSLGREIDRAALRRLIATLGEETDRMRAKSEAFCDDLRDCRQKMGELRDELEKIRREAFTDPLTGVANRKRFETSAAELAAEVTDGRRSRFALLLVDIDNFKPINDQHGHRIGDQVLRLVAGKLQRHIKGRDVLARYGGDEFVVLLPDTGLEDAARLAEKLRQAIQRHVLRHRLSGEAIGCVTVSIGVAAFVPGQSVADLVDRADQALYRAKHAGRNRTEVERPA